MSGQITTNDAVLQILAQKLVAPSLTAISVEDEMRAAQHVLDWLGVAFAGLQHATAHSFVALSRVDDAFLVSASLPCTALSGEKKSWHRALALNAALGNLLEMDDLHRTSILHPGPIIVPAAIALAEQVGASGAALLHAIIRGYEATIRIGRALGTSHYQYFHNTSTCGAFGAAAAAASLLGLNHEQTVHALANAGSRTGGLWQMRHEPCETKSLHNVMAAQTGVEAAFAAHAGVRGPARLLEGTQGMFAAMSKDANAHDVVGDLDAPWQIHSVSFKPWPACRHAHPAIDAALALLPRLSAGGFRVSADQIARIDISTYKSAIDFCDRVVPTTELEAKFSLQHAVASVFTRGTPTLADFREAGFRDAAVSALRERAHIAEDADMTRNFPEHYAAAVSVTMRDGSVIEHMQADAKGDPELPLRIEEITAKARMLLESAAVDDTDQLIDRTLQIARINDVREWTAMWRQPLRVAA
jgi:2-methylcitrate dehydratase PrpD